MGNYLVVANQTLLSPELTDGLLQAFEQDPSARFVLIVPATPVEDLLTPEGGASSQIAARRAGQALIHLTDLGLPIRGAHVGATSLTVAIDEAISEYQPEFSAIIVCTFPAGLSRWLDHADLRGSLEKAFHLPVTHIIAHPAHH
jgi:hypothetical protein